MLNSLQYLDDPSKRHDSRWAHRSSFDWEKAERRFIQGSIEQRIFLPLKKLIAIRKETPAFADLDNRELIPSTNDHVLVFSRTDPMEAC